jgi:hypothetical protein
MPSGVVELDVFKDKSTREAYGAAVNAYLEAEQALTLADNALYAKRHAAPAESVAPRAERDAALSARDAAKAALANPGVQPMYTERHEFGPNTMAGLVPHVKDAIGAATYTALKASAYPDSTDVM